MTGTRHEQIVKERLDAAFPDLTQRELIAILSFAKLVRFRARNNNSLEAMCRRMFPEFTVKHIVDPATGWNRMYVNDILVEEGGE